MKPNLTKREIRQVSTLELAFRFNRLMLKGELLSAHEITVGDARETLWIEEELHRRLIKSLGCDPYPPDRIEEKAPSNYMISLLKSRSKPTPKATEIIHPCSVAVTKKAEAELNTEDKFGFKITITSSIGSVVTTQNVKVNSKSDADFMARKMIDQLGLKKAKYKIS